MLRSLVGSEMCIRDRSPPGGENIGPLRVCLPPWTSYFCERKTSHKLRDFDCHRFYPLRHIHIHTPLFSPPSAATPHFPICGIKSRVSRRAIPTLERMAARSPNTLSHHSPPNLPPARGYRKEAPAKPTPNCSLQTMYLPGRITCLLYTSPSPRDS